MTKLEEFKALQASVASFATIHKDEILSESIAAAFKVSSDIKAILINGYTPGFNDGDPCTHSQYSVIDGNELTDNISDNEELVAFILGYKNSDEMYDALEELDQEPEDALSNLGLPEFKYEVSGEVNSILDGMADVLEEVMGTDWRILAVLQDDGTVKTVVDEYYDCGY